MQNNDFFERLFTILEIPAEIQIKLRKSLGETINFNVSSLLLNELPQEKLDSLGVLIHSGKTDSESLAEWIHNEKIVNDKQITAKINDSVVKTLEDFFKILASSLDSQKKREAINFAQSIK